MSVSIIIPIHRLDQNFNRCLESVGRCDPPADEVVVVLDGIDRSDFSATRIPALKALPLARQGGPARARNAGAQAARSSVLLFIDGDVVVPPEICRRVETWFAEGREIDAVFGSYDAEPAAVDRVSQYKNLLHHFTHQHSSKEAFTFWTGCGAMRRDSFLELGGFDERFKQASIEDIDMGYRLTAKGGIIVLDREMQVKHLKRWSFWEMAQTDLFLRAIPWSRLIYTHGILNNDMNIGWRSRFSVITCVLAVVMFFSTFLVPFFIFPLVVFIFLFLLLNWQFWSFLYRRKGLLMVFSSLPLHFLYYLISATAFGAVSIQISGAFLKKCVCRGKA